MPERPPQTAVLASQSVNLARSDGRRGVGLFTVVSMSVIPA